MREYGVGKKVKAICLPWVDYGQSTIRKCSDCTDAYVYVKNDNDDVVIDISSDSEVGEEDDGDEVGYVVQGEQSAKTGLGCNSDCECLTDCDEECECMLYQYGMQRAHNHNVVHLHVSSAVERSLCSDHYKGFQSFHENMFEFCSSVSLLEDFVKKTVFDLFPNAPLKMTILDWVKFDDWTKKI
ncbi:hypothetical protein FRX31_021574 [Thalictrum thalictroides]|uniref:Uncharacterized protein n=1 Tax=Thalictrum thalictroides TaxID=46969 RepID=A0A7J6VUR6_THATH|nr:hypothetical protein FRX31_021574 [Thalictrum thalictroides]